MEFIWGIVKIMVPFWAPIILTTTHLNYGHLLGPYNFDNHPFREPEDMGECSMVHPRPRAASFGALAFFLAWVRLEARALV